MWNDGDRCIFVRNATGHTLNVDTMHNVDVVLIPAGTTAQIYSVKYHTLNQKDFVVVDLDDHEFSGYLVRVAEAPIYPY